MQRRSILIPVIALLVVGGVWANSIFPDRADIGFSAFPTGPGTIGGALTSWFDITTGTANNTALLAGRSSTGYLQNTTCTIPQEVWKGIDATGKVVCGPRAIIFAKILEGSMQVNGTTRPPGTILREGDRIDTDTTQTGTIQFTDDISIARLSTSTSIILERGNTDGTIAQVVLDQGLLWGRVLTSTGINIGGGGLIAGVRGTSIAVEKDRNNLEYRLVIPHSQESSDAASLSIANTNTAGTERSMSRSTAMYYNSGTNTAVATIYNNIFEKPLSGLYTDTYTDRLGLSKWIRENTAKDIAYLDAIGTPVAMAEVAVTDPDKMHTINSAEFFVAKRALCNNENIWDTSSNSCIYGYAEYSTGSRTDLHLGNRDIVMTSLPKSETLDDGHFCDNDPYQLQGIPGPNQTRIFTYDNLINFNLGGTPFQVATDKAILTATFPGLTTGKTLVINTASCDRTNAEGTAGWNYSSYPHGYYYQGTDGSIELSQIGQAIIYNDSAFLANLAGKTITIELGGAMPTTCSIAAQCQLAYFGGSTYIKYTNLGGWTLATGITPISTGTTTIQFKIEDTTSVSEFKIGNSGNGLSPLKNTIKKITIQ